MLVTPQQTPATSKDSIMRTFTCSLVALLVGMVLQASAAELKTDDEKALYALGAAVANNITGFDLTPAELEIVKAGFSDAALKKKLALTPTEYFPKINELQQKRMAAAATVEKKAGQTYLDKEAATKGATKTPSGIVMTTLKPGTGASPAATDKVKVHYHGTLMDGKVFDSSVQRNEPAEFGLSEVIPCWTEAVQKMKVGGKSRVVCPADLAYGDRGAPPDIRPGATLIFEVELLDIVK
jgi:FKBP-type peptidyl-prolyl cis-trans isomerase FkpA/FKBP-type peptidyl-prolyl cis-trans isomerase FklB